MRLEQGGDWALASRDDAERGDAELAENGRKPTNRVFGRVVEYADRGIDDAVRGNGRENAGMIVSLNEAVAAVLKPDYGRSPRPSGGERGAERGGSAFATNDENRARRVSGFNGRPQTMLLLLGDGLFHAGRTPSAPSLG